MKPRTRTEIRIDARIDSLASIVLDPSSASAQTAADLHAEIRFISVNRVVASRLIQRIDTHPGGEYQAAEVPASRTGPSRGVVSKSRQRRIPRNYVVFCRIPPFHTCFHLAGTHRRSAPQRPRAAPRRGPGSSALRRRAPLTGQRVRTWTGGRHSPGGASFPVNGLKRRQKLELPSRGLFLGQSAPIPGGSISNQALLSFSSVLAVRAIWRASGS